jgi:hypothetical protein
MRYLIVLSCAAVLVGCKQAQTSSVDSVATAPAAAPAPKPLALTDVAGKWNVIVKNEAGDTVLTRYVLTATPSTTGWTIKFPKRKAIPARVVASGDSLVIDAGPYESVLKKGVKVSTHSVERLSYGKLVGVSMAHFRTKHADSLRTIRSEGTRMQ